MAKNSVSDWDTTAGNNTDIGGININEGCLAANINNALRELMAQVATYGITGSFATRAALVTWAGSNTLSDGECVLADGLVYKGSTGATDITDLSGIVPVAPVYPNHFADNTTPGTTDMTAAIEAAQAYTSRVKFRPETYGVSSLKPDDNQQWEGIYGLTKIKTLASAGSTVSAVSRNADGLEGELTNFSARGIIFDASNKEVAFLTFGFSNIWFELCDFINGGTYGFGSQARPGYTDGGTFTGTETNDGIYFNACRFLNNGSDGNWDGIDVKYATRGRMSNCVADNNTDAGINLRGEWEIANCSAYNNTNDNYRLQATDLTASNPSRFTVANLLGDTTTGSVGSSANFRVAANATNNTYIQATGLHIVDGSDDGILVSGAVYGSISGRVAGHVTANIDDSAATGSVDWQVTNGTNGDAGWIGLGIVPVRALHINVGTDNEAARFESSDAFCLAEFKDSGGTVQVGVNDADFIVRINSNDIWQYDTSGNRHIFGTDAGTEHFRTETEHADFSVPVKVPSYTVAGVPTASTAGAGATIYVSDETGGATLAFSDGTNWRRVTDRAVIS